MLWRTWAYEKQAQSMAMHPMLSYHAFFILVPFFGGI